MTPLTEKPVFLFTPFRRQAVVAVTICLLVVMLPPAAVAHEGHGDGGSEETGDGSAEFCAGLFGFGHAPVPVAKSADGSQVLAEVRWGRNDVVGCYLVLDDIAQATLRAAIATGLHSASRSGDGAAEFCAGLFGFGHAPVPVAKSADGSQVLAEVRWGRNDVVGCYLTLNDNAVVALRASYESEHPVGSVPDHWPIAFSISSLRWCGLLADRTLVCGRMHSDRYGQTNRPEGRFLSVSVGGERVCGVREDHTVACWGGTWLSPPLVTPPGNFQSVNVGPGGFACGVRDDSTVACWGIDREHACPGSSATRTYLEFIACFNAGGIPPPPVPPSGQFLSVSVGGSHACGVQADRTVVCWGDNAWGRLDVPDGRFLSVSAGGTYSCGVLVDNSAVCWGLDRHGLLDVPEGRYRSVSAKGLHACGVLVDHSAVCWGLDQKGETDVPEGQWRSMFVGTAITCGWQLNGALACRGNTDKDLTQLWSPEGPDPIQVVYAIPSGLEPVPRREQQIVDAVNEVQAWFRAQTEGRHLLFEHDGDRISVVTVELSDNGSDPYQVETEVREKLGASPPNLLVFGEGNFPAAGSFWHWACAHGGGVVMISIRRCQQYTDLAWVTAHELVHMLGAALDCAPNYSHLGHVDDALHDILFHYHTFIPLSRSVLDVGRDDYYMHGREDCGDISLHPLLVTPAPNESPSPD